MVKSMSPQPPLLLTRRMTAERLSCSVDTIRNYEAKGRLKRYRRSGGDTGLVLHDPAEVERLANEILGKAEKVAS